MRRSPWGQSISPAEGVSSCCTFVVIIICVSLHCQPCSGCTLGIENAESSLRQEEALHPALIHPLVRNDRPGSTQLISDPRSRTPGPHH